MSLADALSCGFSTGRSRFFGAGFRLGFCRVGVTRTSTSIGSDRSSKRILGARPPSAVVNSRLDDIFRAAAGAPEIEYA